MEICGLQSVIDAERIPIATLEQSGKELCEVWAMKADVVEARFVAWHRQTIHVSVMMR